ncbi:MAG: hypothetical protein R6X25_11565 [Candidatus Krumholzibacteriia bacterium]
MNQHVRNVVARIAHGRAAATLLVLLLAAALAGCAAETDSTAQNRAADADAPAGGITVTSREPNPDCAWVDQGPLEVAPDLEQRVEAYAETELAPDLAHLTETQRDVLGKLVDAARIMDRLFTAQAWPCREQMLARVAELPVDQRRAVQAYLEINYGPWDRRMELEPFVGAWPHPAGANYYPLDLTEAETAQIAADEEGLASLTTMVRRDENGALAAIPYSEFFRPGLEAAARLLREAADLTENESLAAFLRARADAFLDDDYYASDLLWMDLDSPVEVTIGPYETYEDGLFGFKAAFEAFVTVTDPEESERLARFKQELPWLESNLPVPDDYKNPNRGSESPIRVVDEVFSAGDTRAGVQTIAFNLPNDERVREAKGSKKVMLRNVMNAKFRQILQPIAGELVHEEQQSHLTAEAFFLHTLWHEMSHGLGPGKLRKDGRDTEVRLELREHYSTLEEAKADAMGEWAIFAMHREGRGEFPEDIVEQQTATYLAGLFRSVRFGIDSAHGAANAIQYNYLKEKGVLTHDEDTGRFHLDAERFPAAIEQLVREILVLQAEGDYAGTGAFIERHGHLPSEVRAALDRLGEIPVDIRPVFSHYPES